MNVVVVKCRYATLTNRTTTRHSTLLWGNLLRLHWQMCMFGAMLCGRMKAHFESLCHYTGIMQEDAVLPQRSEALHGPI